jgi:hypothetical protein
VQELQQLLLAMMLAQLLKRHMQLVLLMRIQLGLRQIGFCLPGMS